MDMIVEIKPVFMCLVNMMLKCCWREQATHNRGSLFIKNQGPCVIANLPSYVSFCTKSKVASRCYYMVGLQVGFGLESDPSRILAWRQIQICRIAFNIAIVNTSSDHLIISHLRNSLHKKGGQAAVWQNFWQDLLCKNTIFAHFSRILLKSMC